jgi:hypothetical protein
MKKTSTKDEIINKRKGDKEVNYKESY